MEYKEKNRSLSISIGKSKIEEDSGYTETVNIEIVGSTAPDMEQDTTSVSKLIGVDSFEKETVQSRKGIVFKSNNKIRIWKGRVIETKDSSFIAELTEPSTMQQTVVEIDDTFPGINLKDYTLYSRFMIEQEMFENGNQSTIIRKTDTVRMDPAYRKRLVEIQMKKLSYLFGGDEKL